ncbi:Lipase (class 3) [Seminavis robusta]|uniref:Lipase (Class 3) n=1 Tax=Seminavis robusta TaxID=568900 RepID=A0A9N8EW72_9STRA|nr:Lipase (class 3) [Seminavis robusta]|eukprot:Sro1736_g294400.1 Lipase (class 3) (796) ;mRNA; f:13588-17231
MLRGVAKSNGAATIRNNTDVARRIWPYTPYREAKLTGKLERRLDGDGSCDAIETFDFANLDEESSIFDLPGGLNAMDLVKRQMVKAEERRVNSQIKVLFPQVARADGADVSHLGGEAGVGACEPIDFVDVGDVLAFGFENGRRGTSFCAALNPCTHTYALGQEGIIPDVKIGGIIFVSLDAVGFSLTKQLGKHTLNRMWDGTGEPEQIFVDGHIAVRGTGSMGIKFSPKVKATINVDLSLIIDVAPNSRNNEIAPNSQALKDNNDNSENVDFEILLSGEAGVVFEVVSSLGGRTETHTVDLSGVITVEADMYLYVSGEDTKLMLAASINVMLGGICGMTPYAAVICEIFSGDSELVGAIRSYADKTGFGVQLELSGYIGLKYDFVEDEFDWPSDGHSFSFGVTLGYSGSTINACVQVDGNESCFRKCDADSQCDDDQFCDLLGFCIKRKKVAHVCHKNAVCKSGYCVGGFCSECPTVDRSAGCIADAEFCTQKINKIGLRCEAKRNNGRACLDKVACKSDICSGGFCSECARIDSEEGCDNNKFCSQTFTDVGYTCINKRNLGGTCSSNIACNSGRCVNGYCSECSQIDSTDGCGSNEFCTQLPGAFGHRCKDKLDLGGACLKNVVCKSGKCKGGYCSECDRIDSTSGCSSGKFCTQRTTAFGYRCDAKRGLGSTCSSNVACTSADCVGGFCSDCRTLDSTSGCSSGKFCTQTASPGYRCQNQKGEGGTCSSNNACRDFCVAGFCQQCSNDGHCGTDRYCSGWPSYDCKNKKNRNKSCGAKKECKSNKCKFWKCK